jgi:RNA polymerase sigma factor for flagellar operon FliA
MTTQRDEIVARFADLIAPIARSISRAASVQIDDLEQEGMLALIAAAAKWDAERADTFPAYARIRIRGAMLDFLRGVPGGGGELHEDQVADNVVSIDTAMCRREEGQHAVQNLTDRQRAVIDFRYKDGLTQVATGKLLGISQEAVRRLEGRAVKSMKKRLSLAA